MKQFYLFFLIPGIVYGTSITISGSPQPLIVSKARAGQEPESVIDNSTTYKIQISQNQTALLSVSIDSPMPEGTNLLLSLASPDHAIATSSISLKTVPQIAINNIPSGTYNNLAITYEYKATVAAGIVPLCVKNVIFTLIENAP